MIMKVLLNNFNIFLIEQKTFASHLNRKFLMNFQFEIETVIQIGCNETGVNGLDYRSLWSYKLKIILIDFQSMISNQFNFDRWKLNISGFYCNKPSANKIAK